jgi:hypothetical protein
MINNDDNSMYCIVEYDTNMVIATTWQYHQVRSLQHEHVVRTNKDTKIVKIQLPQVSKVFNFDSPVQVVTII